MNTRLREFLSILGFLYLQNGKAEKAIVLLEALQKLAPDDTWSDGALAYAHELAGSHAEVLKRIQSVREPERSSVTTRLIESRALWGIGRQDEATALARQLTQRMRAIHE